MVWRNSKRTKYRCWHPIGTPAIFSAVWHPSSQRRLGASNYTYAEATATQSLPDWIGAHVRALTFMGGVPAQLVPDNPKVGVDRANWYEPGLNRTYLDLATHYGTAILPTRTRKPRDKAKAEVAVLVVERWILARLRNRRFFSPAELNRAIAELVADLNARPMRRLGVSRRDLFVELDRPALKELPAEPYQYAEWRPPAAPGAGLSGVHRHPAPGASIRCRAPGGGLRSRPRHRCSLLRLDPIDPQARSRPAGAAPAGRRATAARPPQYPRPPLLPSTG